MVSGLVEQACKSLQLLERPDTIKKVRQMAKEFEEKNKSLICRELKGIDTGTPLRSCPGCIEDAVRIIGEHLCI